MLSKLISTIVFFFFFTASFLSAQDFIKISAGAIVNDGGFSASCAWGDFDNDGDIDLFVSNGQPGEESFLYSNNGDGTFSKVTGLLLSSDNSLASSWGDFDNDGDLDLFLGARSRVEESALYRNDIVEFTKSRVPAEDNGGISGASWGDYDNDGALDLFLAVDNFEGGQRQVSVNRLYRNNGDELARITSTILDDDLLRDSRGCAWADYDTDGHLDLFLAAGGNNFLYQNNGNGSFTKITTGEIVTDGGSSQGGSWGDYDNDGDLDLFVANTNGQDNFLYRNNGNGSFTKISEGAIVNDAGLSSGSAWADYDNDGDLDLFVANTTGQDNFLYRNEGTGNFTKISEGVIVNDGGSPSGAAWADYDNDGDLDLFVANEFGENNALYKNTGNDNHWLNVQLTGSLSNRSAIGARVNILASINGSPVRQTREISAQTGYRSQNSMRAHFGLGDAASIDSMRISWPSSGSVNIYTNVPVDTFLTLRENNRPGAGAVMPVVTMAADSAVFMLDLNTLFVDPEADTLTYAAAAIDTSIAKASLLSNILTITLVNETTPGQTRIIITADDGRVDDGRGDTETTTIEVNRNPFVVNAVPDQRFFRRETAPEFVADLQDVFADPDSDALTYSSASSDSSVAIATVTGSNLFISTSDSLGEARILITAADSRGGMNSTEFTVSSVTVNTRPHLRDNGIPDQVLITRGQPFRLDLNSVFIDDEGDALTFAASTSNDAAAIATVSSDTLFVIPGAIGLAVITVRANDPFGSQGEDEFNVEVLRSFRPVIAHNPIMSQNSGQSIAIEADITDDEGALGLASLNYRVAGDAGFESMPMDTSAINDTTFHVTGVIPAAAVTDRGVEYFITARDTHGVQVRLPAAGIYAIRVRVGGEGVLTPGCIIQAFLKLVDNTSEFLINRPCITEPLWDRHIRKVVQRRFFFCHL